jgi:hypothetical protein
MTVSPFSAAARRSAVFWSGFALAAASVVLPALALPGLSSPPLPLAVLWAAYGWASYSDASWRAPAYLFGLGLLQDALAGGPFGLYALVYTAAYPISRMVAGTVSSATLFTDWGGFMAMLAAITVVAMAAAPWALDGQFATVPWALALLSTGLLYPLTRGLYMSEKIG